MKLTERLRQYAADKEIDLLGITNMEAICCIPWDYDKEPSHYLPCRTTQTGPDTYEPKQVMPEGKAIIVTGMYMYGFDKIQPSVPGCPRGNIGPWTRGYVEAGRYATDRIEEFLKKEGYHTRFTNELPYRTLAVKCGMGKIGRNGFLFAPGMGCYIRLGAVVTDAPLETVDKGTKSEDVCGKCRVCVDACPTGALKGTNDMDADSCLHLWQQGKGKYGDYLPPEERHKCGNYLMRTGRCLEVCVRNKKLIPRKHFPFQAEQKEDSPELIPLVLASEEEYRKRLPVHVYKYGISYIRRDAIMALGNSKDKAAIVVLEKGLKTLGEKERGLCAWSLGEIGGPAACEALKNALRTEKSSLVLKEIKRAIQQNRQEEAGNEKGKISGHRP